MGRGFHLQWGRWTLDLETRPQVMGIINVTPDSFSDGGDFFSQGAAIDQGLRLVEAGADLLDVGGESTRPGAERVSEAQELDRVAGVVAGLAGRVDVPISVDTYKSGVAEAALAAGAAIINDISAGRFDPRLLELAASAGVPLILMHMKGEPHNMQKNPVYDDLIGEVGSFLREAVVRALAAGVKRDLIVLDPGIGFGKTFDHNLILINRLKELTRLGQPLLVGPSRKAFLGHILGGVPPKDRDVATAAAVTLSAYHGAHILRVHDVRLAREVLAVTAAVMREHA
jgi:dihydropteroate synthase